MCIRDSHWTTTGNLHNVYTVLVISMGLVGLALYVCFLLSLRLPLLRYPYIGAAFFAWLVAALSTGHLIYYYYWGYLYVVYLAYQNSLIELAVPHPSEPSLQAACTMLNKGYSRP
jgi:hypothetical protein